MYNLRVNIYLSLLCAERRHVPTRVRGHAFLAGRSESLRMVVYIHFLFKSSWKFYQLAAGQLLSGQPVRYGKGRWYVPSITYKITPAGPVPGHSPPASQAGRPVGLVLYKNVSYIQWALKLWAAHQNFADFKNEISADTYNILNRRFRERIPDA